MLREFDYGEYEGVTSRTVHQSRPDWELFKDGCPGGESPAQVYQRAGEFIKLATAAGGAVLVFAHGHILRAITVVWLRLDITAATALQLDVATLSKLQDGDHGRVLALWNAP